MELTADRKPISRSFKIGLAIVAMVSGLLLVSQSFGWLPFSWLETCGSITGAWCVFLVVGQKIWNFPLGIISCTLYLIFFYQGKLYADSGLQIVFIILGVHGWIAWGRGVASEKPIQRVPLLESTVLMVLFPSVWLGLVKSLEYVGGAAPVFDAFITTASIFSQYLLNRRYIESWLGWIVVDQVSVYLFITREMYLTAGLYTLFLLMCVAGWLEWRKHVATEPQP
jgi:nicotinamide mononucleotide transporter